MIVLAKFVAIPGQWEAELIILVLSMMQKVWRTTVYCKI